MNARLDSSPPDGGARDAGGTRAERLRVPGPADLDAIHRLGQDAWGDGLSDEAYLDACRRSAKYGRGTWHARRAGGRIASALIVYGDGFGLPAGCHGIGSVATAKDHRGCGHASRLLGDVLTALTDAGSRGAFLFADVDTGLYGRHGFVEVGRRGGSPCLWRALGTEGGAPPSLPDYF